MPNLTLASPKRSIRTATASLMAVPTSESHPSCRLHALDALRGIAMLLGVVLHSSISYMEQRMPDLLWAVQDSSRSAVFDWLFWWLHGFRLPLFFVIAGFFCGSFTNAAERGSFSGNAANVCSCLSWPASRLSCR